MNVPGIIYKFLAHFKDWYNEPLDVLTIDNMDLLFTDTLDKLYCQLYHDSTYLGPKVYWQHGVGSVYKCAYEYLNTLPSGSIASYKGFLEYLQES